MSQESEIIQHQMIDWKNWEPKMLSSLVFIRSDEKVLLIRKKTGLGAGKINAPGGKIESGENAETAAVREVEEEVKLKVKELREMGTLKFQFIDESQLALHCTVFMTSEFIGEAKETIEAAPFWCANDEIPYNKMWADDICWLPGMLEGNCFEGEFVFRGDSMIWKDVRWH